MSIETYQIQDDKGLAYSHKLRFDMQMPPLIFQGITENDTPTEIFIDNTPNFRLILPKNSVAYASWIGAAFNITDGVGTTHGNVYAGAGSFTVRRADTAFALVGAAVGTGFIFTADDTNDRMVCTVTGVASKRIIWNCRMDIVVAESRHPSAIPSGEFTGIRY